MLLRAATSGLRSFQDTKSIEFLRRVDDASLDDRVREHRGDGVGEALEAIDDSQHDILGAAVPELVHDPEPELGAFVLLDPQAEHLLAAVGAHAQRDVDGLGTDEPFSAVKMAIENLQPCTASDLTDKHHELMAAAAGTDSAKFIEAFLSFRKSLFADCDNDLLISFIERIDNQTEALKVRAFAHPDVRILIVDQYGKLMRAVLNRDIDGAQSMLTEHHRLGRRAYEAAIGDLPSPGRNGNSPGRG